MEVHFIMSKLIRNQKIEIYEKRTRGLTISSLSKEYNVSKHNLRYLVKLIDKHGIGVLRDDKNRYYSPKLKNEIINKVIIDNQSVLSTAIEYSLPNDGLLFNWIKSYKDNGCVIVEKRKGRLPTMKKNTDMKKYEDMTPEEKINYLQKKNLYLEAEVEYLKKLRAVVQERKNQQQKKK